jgi:hypothetical protein
MKTVVKTITAALLMAALCGCSTLRTAGKLAAANNEYAKVLLEVYELTKAKPGFNPGEGYVYQRVYYYQGTECRAEDITWKDMWVQTGGAGTNAQPSGAVPADALTPEVQADLAEITALIESLGITAETD